MLKYNLYILKLLAAPAALVTLSLTSIIWLTQALRYVDFIINRGLDLHDFFYLTFLLTPSLLLIVIPPSLFIATLFTYQKLSGESELIALQAGGLSPWQLARPALIAGTIGAILCYLFALILVPLSRQEFKNTQAYLRDNYASILLQEDVFNSPIDGLTLFIRERDKDGKLKGVIVHDERNKEKTGQEITMMAREAQLIQTTSGASFYLTDGMQQERKNGRVSWLNFDSYNLDLSLYNSQSGKREPGVEEKSLRALFSYQGNVAAQQKHRAEAHQRLTWALYALTLTLLAAAFVQKTSFNRNRQWKNLLISSIIALTLMLAALSISNVVVRVPLLWFAPYLLAIAALAASLKLNSNNKKL